MSKNAMSIAVYPGSFDPVTLGHLNIIQRASALFDKLIVAVGDNYEKAPWFSPEKRCELIRQSTTDLTNIEVHRYQGLTVRYVQEVGAKIMVRGVRPITDIPAEITLMMANRRLAPDVETLFLIADGELAHVSSSLIKQIADAADENVLASFLSPPAIEAVLAREQNRS
ncbi:MAG: pantetheine-phosphate adenylyltransferase [Thermoguttaceae bacterium]|nr:pantetheine-phosphate adenylyltransferase [Thermoguttaceae bacterium]